MERRPNTQVIQWFLEANAAGKLRLDPPYQRRAVWSPEYQRFFIDTVLRNFPSPPIFLAWEIRAGSPTLYNVVDGKQRLTAIIQFTEDAFHLRNLFRDEGYPDAYWSDLPQALRDKFVKYELVVENITEASDDELRNAFDRLNRNVARLTAQELRHAQFPGVFLQRMEALAEAPFWSTARVATPANIRRMRDVEFVSELFVLTMHGPQDGASDVLDVYYAMYDEEIPDEEIHRSNFEAILRYLADLPLDWTRTRWKNLSDLYSLWGALRAFQADDALPEQARAAQTLTAFSEIQEAIAAAMRENAPPPGDHQDRRYYDASRQGPNKDTNREARISILSDRLAS